MPYSLRREALIDRLTELARADDRIAALWLQGSLADGTADPYSDVDAYLAVHDDRFEELYAERAVLPERLGAVLAFAESPALKAVHCLMDGPVKLDLLFERLSAAPERERPAARILVDKGGIGPCLKTGWTPRIEDAARMIDTRIRLTHQGASWPVRLLSRGQWATFLMVELELINDHLMVLMAAQVDPRLLFKNRLSVPRLLRPDQQAELEQLSERAASVCLRRDAAAMRAAHLAIQEALVREGRAACAALGIPFPLSADADASIRAFYLREWPET
jgi:predicted nucleotidyltransferase